VARAPFALSPLPERLRLSCRRPFGKPPAPPLGLASWSEEPDAGLCILLDLPSSWPGTGLGDPDLVAAQVPEASSLPKGQLIVLLARGAPEKEGLRRLMAKRTWASPTIRATVLLARGYARIGAGIDAKTRSDLVWGYA
jgi:hypothetical protein